MSKSNAYSIHLEKAIDRIAGACSVLTRDDITQFIFNGYVLVKGAFSRELAVAITDQAWKELEEFHGVDRGDSRTWNKHFLGPDGVRGHRRPRARPYRAGGPALGWRRASPAARA